MEGMMLKLKLPYFGHLMQKLRNRGKTVNLRPRSQAPLGLSRARRGGESGRPGQRMPSPAGRRAVERNRSWGVGAPLRHKHELLNLTRTGLCRHQKPACP